MLATLVREEFSDPEWIYEPKLDGIRCPFLIESGVGSGYDPAIYPKREGIGNCLISGGAI